MFACLDEPTIPDNVYLMHHQDIRLIDATGGPGAVKAAYSSGKPALGVGPGNTPVYLEKTADVDIAVVDIITSKTFDNGTICASEQTVVIDDEIYDRVLEKFAAMGAHICSDKETRLLERGVIDPETGFMRPIAIGQTATDIARVHRAQSPREHQACCWRPSRAWARGIRSRWKSYVRSWRSTGRIRPPRRCACAWT